MTISLVANNPGTVDAGTVDIVDNTASLNIDLAALDVEEGNYTLSWLMRPPAPRYVRRLS